MHSPAHTGFPSGIMPQMYVSPEMHQPIPQTPVSSNMQLAMNGRSILLSQKSLYLIFCSGMQLCDQIHWNTQNASFPPTVDTAGNNGVFDLLAPSLPLRTSNFEVKLAKDDPNLSLDVVSFLVFIHDRRAAVERVTEAELHVAEGCTRASGNNIVLVGSQSITAVLQSSTARIRGDLRLLLCEPSLKL